MKNINNFNKKNISDPNSNRETIDINLYDLIDGVVRRKIYFFSTFFICILLGFIKTFDKPINCMTVMCCNLQCMSEHRCLDP